MESNIYKKLFEVKTAGIKLQRDTKAFNYKYATLSQIQEKLGKVLEDARMIVTHYISDGYVITELADIETWNSIKSTIKLTEWTKAQDKGSEITYYRRYNLLSLLDLEVEDDDWKKAQDSTWEKKEDELPRFEDKNLENLIELKKQWWVFTMADIRKKYKVAKRYIDDLEEFVIN